MCSFNELIEAINEKLGSTSGLDSDDVDEQELIGLMGQYTSNPADWTNYALGDLSRNYTRNLVDDTNGKSNILVVCWNPGKGSPIHDHANAHCVMKILQGSLRETIYDTPTEATGVPEPSRETTYFENEVTYISDNIGVHKIENASDTQPAISLHLYTPPHAANFGFNIFNEKSGKMSHIKNAPLFSAHGEVIKQAPLRSSQPPIQPLEVTPTIRLSA